MSEADTTAQSSGRSARRVRMGKSDRRSQILDVATSLIAERGYWGLTIRDVAAGCGITEAGLLHHFPSKDVLLIAVLEHRDAADKAALAEQLGVTVPVIDGGPTPFGLRTLCSVTVQRNSSQPEIVRLYTVLQGESLYAEHPAYDYYVRREQAAMSLLSRAALTETISPEFVETIARETMAAMDGLQLRWLRSLGSMDFVAEWEAFADRLFHGLVTDLAHRARS